MSPATGGGSFWFIVYCFWFLRCAIPSFSETLKEDCKKQ
jgi:hypothetical protein